MQNSNYKKRYDIFQNYGTLGKTLDHVVGLLELPVAYQREGMKLFVSLRKATAQESDVPCYTNLPEPPSPRYVVVAVDSLKCPIILSK